MKSVVRYQQFGTGRFGTCSTPKQVSKARRLPIERAGCAAKEMISR